MFFVFIGALVLSLFGIVSFFCKGKKAASLIGFSGILLGSILGIMGLIDTVTHFGPDISVNPGNFNWTPEPNYFYVTLPPLFILAPCCALHALDYIHERHNIFWGFFNLLVASIVFIAFFGIENPICFLFFWEIMGATSFALVAFEYDNAETKKAAWLYALSAVAGGLSLIVALLLANYALSEYALLIFILGVIGFGLKSGVAMVHFWLPPAHAAAPAPVSALMSGAMNNMGVMGILSLCPILCFENGLVEHVMGYSLVVLGIAGALGAIIFALAQNHLKRIIAYSSVENFGIMTLAMGIGFTAYIFHLDEIGIFAFLALIFHMYNHAMLKGLLFITAGAVHIGAHTYDIENLGGLIKKMPFVAYTFIFGAIGISGIPPFGPFVSELMIYIASFMGLLSGDTSVAIISLVTIISLALVGGIATATFTKAAGTVFLGEPRSEKAIKAANVPWRTKAAIAILAVMSVIIALIFTMGTYEFLRTKSDFVINDPWFWVKTFIKLPVIFIIFIVLSAIIFFVTKTGKRIITCGPTWDCGYEKPSARMQYTGNSFSRPLALFFSGLLKTKDEFQKPNDFFPEKTERTFKTEDFSIRAFWKPLFRFVTAIAEKAHHLQSGHLHIYILFMVIAIIAMLFLVARN